MWGGLQVRGGYGAADLAKGARVLATPGGRRQHSNKQRAAAETALTSNRLSVHMPCITLTSRLREVPVPVSVTATPAKSPAGCAGDEP